MGISEQQNYMASPGVINLNNLSQQLQHCYEKNNNNQNPCLNGKTGVTDLE